MSDFDKARYIEFLKSLLYFLPKFFKNPIEGMKNAPNLNWYEVISLQFIVSLASGLLSGIISKSFIFLFWGVFIYPFFSILVSFVACLLLHYGILFFFQKEYSIRQTYIILVLANLPFLVLRLISPIVPSIDIIGFLIVGFLLVVGLVENYGLDKKKVIKLVFYIVLGLAITWLIQSFLLYRNVYAML